MVRACAAGVERKDYGNNARFMMRDVATFAKDSGHLSVEGGNIAEGQTDVEPAESDYDIWDALAGSDIVKERTAVFEAKDNKFATEIYQDDRYLHAFKSGLFQLSEQEYQERRRFKRWLNNKNFHSIKIQQDKARAKLTDHTRMRP